jgi:hypothetical protein
VDVGGIVSREVGDRGGDVVGQAGFAVRGGGGELVECLAHRGRALGAGRAGADGVDRTPEGPYSAAHALVSKTRAALLDPYRAMPGWPNWATIVVTLMIEPLPRAAIAGASSATRKNGTLTFTP